MPASRGETGSAGVSNMISAMSALSRKIQTDKQMKAQEKFDDINLQIKQAQLDKAKQQMQMQSAKQSLAAVGKTRSSNDPYDRYFQMADRYTSDEANAKRAISAAEKTGDPEALFEAERKLAVVQMVGQRLMKDADKSKPVMKKVKRTLEDGTEESYEVPFDPAEEEARIKSQSAPKVDPLISGAENALLKAQGDFVEKGRSFGDSLPLIEGRQEKRDRINREVQALRGMQGTVQTPSASMAPAAPVAPAAPAALSPQDTAALSWAAANPTDPRAASIKQKLGAP